MFGLETLNILIGLATIYLVFAVACTACVEAISARLSFRSANLHDALSELLAGDVPKSGKTGKEGKTKGDGKGNNDARFEKFVDAFYRHPLVETLSKGDEGRPSYIPPDIVGKVIESVLVDRAGTPDLENALSALPEGRTRDLLEILLKEAKGNTDEFRKVVAKQFDATMDRASGWFKRKTQKVTLAVAAALVITLNVDTVAIATSLANNPQAQAELVKVAEQQLQAAQQAQDKTENNRGAGQSALEETEEARTSLDDAKKALKAAALPLGWSSWKMRDATTGEEAIVTPYLNKLLGLALSIFAISLGAPFWFKVLDNFNAIRTTGVREDTSQQRGSKGGRSPQAGGQSGAGTPPATP